MADELRNRHKYEQARYEMEQERSSFEGSWRENADYVLPRRVRFFTSDTNQGDRRNQKIIDSTATMAVRTGRAGMMSGVSSPARKWFKLSLPNVNLAETSPVKRWPPDRDWETIIF